MPNGVNCQSFSDGSDSGALRTILGLGERTVIGFVGWFRNWHGLDMLLQSFHDANLREQGGVLLLIGDGPFMPMLKEFVKTHDLQDSVVFTGPLPHEQVPAYLSLIDIAVQPAANEYCCPMKILEYMGMGKAIVAPRQENIEELVRDGQEAILFQRGDPQSMAEALCRLLSNPEETRAMGRRAREAIEEREYLWTANARRVVEMVREPGERKN